MQITAEERRATEIVIWVCREIGELLLAECAGGRERFAEAHNRFQAPREDVVFNAFAQRAKDQLAYDDNR